MIGGGGVDCDPVVKRDYSAEMLGDELGEIFRLRPLPDRIKPVMNGVNLLQDLLLDCWLRPRRVESILFQNNNVFVLKAAQVFGQ
jgi:hypothetical protein